MSGPNRFGLTRRDQAFLAVVALVASLAWLVSALGDRRPASPDLRAGTVIEVTSSADSGPGSLREALFAASEVAGRAEIVFAVSEVRVLTSLPPLVNPDGVVLSGEVTLDAAAFYGDSVLAVHAPYSTVRDLTIRGAPGAALVVRAAGFRGEKLKIVECDLGVDVARGGRGFTLVDSALARNRIGIRLESAEEGVEVRDVEFADHREAAFRAARAEGASGASSNAVALIDNLFERDEISVLLANMPAIVERNDIVGARTAGIYLAGRGGVIRGNRIRDGVASGLIAAGAEGALITDNEIDHNGGAGIVLKAAAGTAVEGNRLHENGIGLLSVFGDAGRLNVVADNAVLGQRQDGVVIVGGSPLLRRNRVRGNLVAGVRILDYVDADGERLAAQPRLEESDFSGNGSDQPVRGTYREPRVRGAS